MPETNVSVKDSTNDRLPQIPRDLLHFIQRDTYSLLVKGYAGTGKTTLALTILKLLGIKNNFFYISTRLSPKQLFQYYPWLKHFVSQSKAQDAGSAHHREAMSTFEDARLDEPESLFERITNQLMDIKSPIIIIDSWDAIASFMDREARLNNERVLQTWRERAGAKLIFISEQPADTTLDFLVDGIVELKQSHHCNAKVRQISLEKLRGTCITRPSYLYTLDGGMFYSFSPYKRISFGAFREDGGQACQVSTRDKIQSGFPLLDTSLGGGYPVKGLVLLELDSHVNMRIALIFLRRIMLNFILGGNPVLLQYGTWLNLSSILDSYKLPLSANKRKLLNRLCTQKKQSAYNLLASLRRVRQRYRNKTLLNIMSAESIQSLAMPGNPKGFMQDTLSHAISQSDLSIVVLPQSHEDLLEVISEVSDIYLRLTMISDTLFLQPLVPSSNLHALVSDGQSNMSLKPLV
ncbi:MAG: RAD55 family ATPase [Nitrososphaera sp.]